MNLLNHVAIRASDEDVAVDVILDACVKVQELLPVIRPPRDFCLSSMYTWEAYWRYFTVYASQYLTHTHAHTHTSLFVSTLFV